VTPDFYHALEERFRGSRELILSRLQVYVPFLTSLQVHLPAASAVDLGCGRGEWLEVLTEQGFAAQGVDQSEAMLAACRDRSLHVTMGDALAFLQQLPDASQAVVSGFHIVEHLPFDTCRQLVAESLRVLLPGGLLILETPNPENLVVGASSFYLDPTHRKPIPPALLAFAVEFAGFARSKVLRLQAASHLSRQGALSLLDVLQSASADYAVVAQKGGAPALVEALSDAFSVDLGTTLESLAAQYQHQLTMSQAQAQSDAAQAVMAAQQMQAQLAAVHASTSWRVTAPLRAVRRRLDLVRVSAWSAWSSLRRVPGLPLGWAFRQADRYPALRKVAARVMAFMPGLGLRLRRARLQARAEAYKAAALSAPSADMPLPEVVAGQGKASADEHARQRTPLEAYFQDPAGRA
jgi:O-antigen chain-terminating methyltransferase